MKKREPSASGSAPFAWNASRRARATVQTDSHGKNISAEVFEGVIQPSETTEWWERRKMVARFPEFPTWREEPEPSWEAKPGLYTLVIVLWDEYEPDTKIDFSIAIGGGR